MHIRLLLMIIAAVVCLPLAQAQDAPKPAPASPAPQNSDAAEEPPYLAGLLLDFSQRPYHNKGTSEFVGLSIGFSGFSVVILMPIERAPLPQCGSFSLRNSHRTRICAIRQQ